MHIKIVHNITQPDCPQQNLTLTAYRAYINCTQYYLDRMFTTKSHTTYHAYYDCTQYNPDYPQKNLTHHYLNIIIVYIIT